jgi:glycosyltransferase involved in cell wall biosynthesis
MQFPNPSETFASHDVRQLAALGVDVSVHSLLPRHRNAEALTAERHLDDIRVTHGGGSEIIRGLGAAAVRPLLALRLIAWILRWCWRRPRHLVRSLALCPRAMGVHGSIRRRRPDVVHLFWGHYPSMVGFLAQQGAAPPRVSMFLGAYDLEMDYGGSAPVARSADVVWTHARANIDLLLQMGIPRDDIVVAYRGTDMNMYGACRQKAPARLVSIGRLIPEKGMDDALETFATVRRSAPDVTLVVLGDGPERARLEALAEDLGVLSAVAFKGHVSHEQVIQELCAAKVFLMMSRKPSERLPNVVKEAMGCRSLCVVSETPGIEELIEHGRSGYVVEQGDTASAARRVLDGLADDESRKTMTDMAYQHLEKHFALADSMTTYRDAWQALVE